jgi:predicted PurR-regulated permease PerM
MNVATDQERAAARKEQAGVALWIGVVVGAVVLRELQWMLLPFVIAGLIAYLCTPLVDLLGKRISRGAAAAVVFLIIVAIVSGIGLLGVPPLFDELTRLVADLQQTFEKLARSLIGNETVSFMGDRMNAAQMGQAMAQGVRSWVDNPVRLTQLGGIGFASIFGVFLTSVLLFYLLLSGRRIMRGLIWLVPPERRALAREIRDRFHPAFKRYLIGVIIVVIYATLAAYAGLGLMLGIKHAAFLALLTGLLEMVPVAGPAISALIAGLVAVRHAASLGSIVAYAIYVAALRLSIDQLLGPLVLGVAARLHPVVIIFAFLAGGVLFGIPGIILAVPMILLVKVSLAAWRGEELS